VKPLDSFALKHSGGELLVLDQRQLPDLEIWLRCDSPAAMTTMIKDLAIRGAPLIGVGAALALAKFAEAGASPTALQQAAAMLRAARPTAVNLMAAMDRMLAAMDHLVATAEEIFSEDAALCERLGDNGQQLIADGDGVLTHCNAGQLATAGIGTALGVIYKAFSRGRRLHVFADETRPLLQGARLTAYELQKWEIPHTLICDNMAAVLMAAGRIQKVFVGADRIARNGDFANKIGTYGVAVLAKHHGIPFYVVAPHTTIDFACADGAGIPVEQRDAEEVRGAAGAFGKVSWAPPGCDTFNPAFDVTPAALVSGYVLDSGFFPVMPSA